jgi:hypothetical protein
VASLAPDVFLEGHHFHPSAQGHRTIAELAANRIVEMLGTPSPAPASGQQKHLNIGYSLRTPLHCAIGETLANTDILSRHGLRGTFLGFVRGKDQDVACRVGAVDVTFSCEVPAMVHLARHPRFAVTGSPGSLGDIAVVVRDGSRTRSITDLRGEAVAVDDGASAMLVFAEWLRAEGMDAGRDVRVVFPEDGAGGAVDLLVRGEVAAAVLWDPWLTEWVARERLTPLKRTPFWSVMFTDQAHLNAETGDRYDAAVREALAWIAANRKTAEAWVSRKSGIPVSVVHETLEKNAMMQGRVTPSLGIGEEVRKRLDACNRFAAAQGMVDVPLALETRIRPAAAAPDAGPLRVEEPL